LAIDNVGAQAFGKLIPLKEPAAPAAAAPAAAAPANDPAAAPQGAPADINVALKPGQAANITLDQAGDPAKKEVPAAGGPAAAATELPADVKDALGQIKTMLDGLVKSLTDLMGKLGIAPDAAPAAGGPAAAAADAAKPADAAAAATDPAATAGGPAAANADAAAADPAAAAAAVPGQNGKDGAPGRDGAAAPAQKGQTIIIPPADRGLLGGIRDFLVGPPQPQIIQIGDGGGPNDVKVVGGAAAGGGGGLLGGIGNFLFGGNQAPQVIKA
jgi:hypothetical protein